MNVNQRSIDTSYAYFEFDLTRIYTSSYHLDDENFTNYLSSEKSSCYIVGESIFISKEAINDEIQIFTYGIDDENLYYGRITFRAIDYLNFEKAKRKEIKISMTKITEVSRKVK